MSRCLAVVGLLQGCTKRPESYPMTAFRVDYHHWSCQQLADEADLLKDALAVASEQRAGGEGGAPEGRNRGGSQGTDFEEV